MSRNTELNPILTKLGFGPKDRVVIFHADDIGVCHASVQAYSDLVAAGTISSAAVMVPCPWFPAVAAYARDHAGTLDLGVHLTLNCEWDTLRWGPLSTTDAASGLVDEQGYFLQRREPVQAGAALAAIRAELAAQIERARVAGIDSTHIDTHMFTLLHPRLLPMYFEMSAHHGIPAFAPRRDEDRFHTNEYFGATMPALATHLEQAEARGFPLFDGLVQLPGHAHEARRDRAAALLHDLPPGLSLFIIHPAIDTPELRAMTDNWRARVADYQLFTSDAWRRHVQNSGVHVIGYRTIRDMVFGDGSRPARIEH